MSQKTPVDSAPAPGFRKPGERLLFVDLYRLIALFLMVQGHLFRALVDTGLTKSFLWQAHESVHKFTASIFLFGAGMIFMIVTRRRWDTYKRFGSRTWHRLRRYFYFLLIGFWLRLPFFSLRKTIQLMDSGLLAKMTAVDVLHVIAVGLILLHLLCMLAGRPRRLLWFLLPLGIAFFVFAPIVRTMQLSGPAPLISWISRQYGSQFTIIPWWGYIFLGACLGIIFPDSGRIADERRLMNVVIIGGLALLGAGIGLAALMQWNFVYAPGYRPDQMIARLGVVTSFMGFCWYLEQWGVARKLKGAFFLSEESLIVYVVHLLLVYGSVLAPGMSRIIDNTLRLPGLMLSFIGVAAVTVAFTWGWHWLKKRNLKALKIVQAAMVIAFLLAYIIRPY
jgi:hypothetical protein